MILDPLANNRWSAPQTVAGFAQAPPNQTLLRFIEAERLDRPVRLT